MRHDGRRPDELRVLDALPDFLEQPHGCVLWSQGKTRVLCTATVEEEIPRWLRGKGRGWMTAEYSLLPASTGDRTQRGVSRGRPDGRTVEIQRLIGRALRAVCDFEALGERTLWLDCDVLQADGGTRCAAITGAYVAAYRALDRMGLSKALPASVAAVSVGVVDGRAVLDLDYPEDSQADTDMNVVMTADGRLVEVQATAERHPFTRDELDELLDLAAAGIEQLARAQRDGRRRTARVRARLATGNPHKLDEFRRALPGWEIELVDAATFPPETGTTLCRECSREGRARPRVFSPDDAWVIGEDSGNRGCGAGRQAGPRVGPLGRRRRRTPARGACRGHRSEGALRLHDRGDRARGPGDRRRGGPRRLRLDAHAAAKRGSATTRSSCPKGRCRPSRSSETTGRRSTRTAPGRRVPLLPRFAPHVVVGSAAV